MASHNGGVSAQSQTSWEPLVDRFGRRHDYLRVSLTDRCNFRCIYCMPEDGVEWLPRAEILSFEEILRLVRVFARLGVRKVRLTGGEPTVRRGFSELIGQIATVEGIERVLITTNGLLLAKEAAHWKSLGLHGVNVSLDTLKEERFAEITRRKGLDDVLRGIEAAITAGLHTKVNVVVLPGVNDDEIVDFVEFIRTRPAQVRFIEFMPFLGNQWNPDRVFGYREMRAKIDAQFRLRAVVGETSDVAKEFEIEDSPGSVGFVTSMTDSFCDGCNRIRLTADGRFKTCLFLPPKSSLRDLMRSGVDDEAIAAAIRADLMTKWAGHPPMSQWSQLDQLSMVQIGG